MVPAGALPPSIADATLKKQWRVPLVSIYSGPIISGDRVFVTESSNKTHEVAIALDRASGKILWRAEWEGFLKVPFFAKTNGDWIRSTPASDGERLYVGGMRDTLVCLDVKTGKQAWDFNGRATILHYRDADGACQCRCRSILDTWLHPHRLQAR